MPIEGAVVDIAPWFRSPDDGFGVVEAVTENLMAVVLSPYGRIVSMRNDSNNFVIIELPPFNAYTRKQFLRALDRDLAQQ